MTTATWWMTLGLALSVSGCIVVVNACPHGAECSGAHAGSGADAAAFETAQAADKNMAAEQATSFVPSTEPELDEPSSSLASSAAKPQPRVLPDPASPCEPPALQTLASIPVNPALAEGNDYLYAVFEVEGDALVGVAYQDEEIARGGLSLWRELIYRIPTNQRMDLVQFEISKTSDPAAATDNSGTGGQSQRLGTVLTFSHTNLRKNQSDPCAPLSRRRGNFDWTLIHEFGHMRNYADGATNRYTSVFPGDTGPGHGYPEDGSPRLDGNWISSYAERAGGDEDCTESFTAYVMLDELPEGDSLAAQKVRWFASLPGYPELRRALRITEFDGSDAPLDPAPRHTYPLEVDPPAWLHGQWAGVLSNGSEIEYEITEDDIVRTRSRRDLPVERWSYAHLRDVEPLSTIEFYESNESFYLHQMSVAGTSASESFRRKGDALLVENETPSASSN